MEPKYLAFRFGDEIHPKNHIWRSVSQDAAGNNLTIRYILYELHLTTPILFWVALVYLAIIRHEKLMDCIPGYQEKKSPPKNALEECVPSQFRNKGCSHTLPATNIAPENGWLEDLDSFWVSAYFQGANC